MDRRVRITNYGLVEQLGTGILVSPSFIFGNIARNASMIKFLELFGLSLSDRSSPRPWILSRWRQYGNLIEVGGIAEFAPNTLDEKPFGGICRDSDIYRPTDTATLAIFIPNRLNKTITLSILLNGQEIDSRQVALNEHGAAECKLSSLRLGEYTVSVESGEISTAFTVAEFSTAPLGVSFIGNPGVIDGHLQASMKITAFDNPLYKRDVIVILEEEGSYCSSQTVTTNDLGIVDVDFDLAGSENDLSFTITASDDPFLTAEVLLPGSAKIDREELMINPLGRTTMMSLLPAEEAKAIRGMYFTEGEVAASPFVLQSCIANEKGEVLLNIQQDTALLKVVILDPIRGIIDEISQNDLPAGETMILPVGGAWCMYAIAAWVKGGTGELQACEKWCAAFKQSTIGLKLDVPVSAKPGERIKLRVSTQKPATVFVYVTDSRVTNNSSLEVQFGRQTRDLIRELQKYLNTREPVSTLEEVAESYWKSVAFESEHTVRSSWIIPDDELRELHSGFLGSDSEAVTTSGSLASSVLNVVARLESSAVIMAKVITIDGEDELPLTLPGAITTYRVQAIACNGPDLDWQEASAALVVTKPLYAELSVPPFAHMSDKVRSRVDVYSTSGRAQLTILVNGQPVKFSCNGQILESGAEVPNGSVEFLSGPGQIQTILEDPTVPVEPDVSEKEIKPLGVFTSTVLRSRVLHPGEVVTLGSLQATSMRVNIGLQQRLAEILDKVTVAVGSYQYQCCEQTSAIMYSCLLMCMQGKGGEYEIRFLEGVEREARMQLQGGGRFLLYPLEESNMNPYDAGLYGITAAQRLWAMRNLADNNNLSADMQDAVRRAVSIGRQALVAYMLPLIPKGEPRNCRDAYDFYVNGDLEDKKKAVAYARSQLSPVGQNLIVLSEGADPVSQRQATAFAAAVLAYAGDLSTALKAMNALLTQVNEEGRLHSTIDSFSFVLALQALSQEGIGSDNTSAKIEINGAVVPLAEAVTFDGVIMRVSAIDSAVVIDYAEEISLDWANPTSASTEIAASLFHNGREVETLRVGDTCQLRISLAQGYNAGDLASFCLPAGLACLRAGVQVHQMTVDFCGRSEISLDVSTVSPTIDLVGNNLPQHWGVFSHNMFVESRSSYSGLMEVSVTR